MCCGFMDGPGAYFLGLWWTDLPLKGEDQHGPIRHQRHTIRPGVSIERYRKCGTKTVMVYTADGEEFRRQTDALIRIRELHPWRPANVV